MLQMKLQSSSMAITGEIRLSMFSMAILSWIKDAVKIINGKEKVDENGKRVINRYSRG